LRDGAADVAILYGEFDHDGIALAPLFTEPRGVALTVAPAVEALGSAAGVVFRPVDGLEPLEFWIARREGDERAAVRAFVETAVAALREA
jgi:DNA-binding transcriptional LysR family regulator